MIQVIDTKRLAEIEHDITDYLFDRHHTINKPLIMDLANWVYHYGDKMYLKAQFDNDIIQVTTTSKKKEQK